MKLGIVQFISSAKRNYKIKILLSFLIIYLLIWFLNFLTPEWGDDYWYKFLFLKDLGQSDFLILNFSDIVISQFNHYFIVNGRSIVHFFVQLFTGITGKQVFNPINSAIFVLFIFWLNKLNYKISFFNFIFIASLVFLLFPAPNETILWMTGSINYLWTSCFICGFLLLLKKYLSKTLTITNSLWIIPCLFIGWSHEGITMPLAASLFIYLLIKKKEIIRTADFYFIIAFIIGVFLCSFSPGTLNRVNTHNLNWIYILLYRIQSVLIVSLKSGCLYAIICISIVYLILLKKNYLKFCKKFYLNNLIVSNAFIFSFGIIFISGFWYERGAIGIALFGILLFLKLINELPGFLSKILKVIFIISGIIIYMLIIPYSILNFKQDNIVMSKIKYCGSTVIIYDELEIPSLLDSFILEKIKGENIFISNWRNRHITKVYGLDNIRFIPKQIYEIIKDDKIDSFHVNDQKNFPFYIFKIKDKDNLEPYFILRKPTSDEIPIYCKPFANKLLKYSTDSIPCQNYEIFDFNNQSYIAILKNDNIDFRLEDIKFTSR